MCTFPGVRIVAPGYSQQKDYEATTVEQKSYEVEILELLSSGLALWMKANEIGRPIEDGYKQ